MKHVFYSDLDGTLFIYKPYMHAPDKSVLRAKTWINEGRYFGIATGRNVADIKLFTKNIEVNVPYVLSNGTVIYDGKTDQVLYQDTLNEQLILEAIAYAEDKDFVVPSFSTPFENVIIKSGNLKKLDQVTFQYVLIEKSEIKNYQFNKMVFFAEKMHHDKLLEDIKKFMAYDAISVQPSGRYFIDIVNKGTNKATGIKRALTFMGIENYRLYTIGDYLNDLEMVLTADVSFAPKNSHEKILAVAQYVVSSNNEHGVYDALQMADKFINEK